MIMMVTIAIITEDNQRLGRGVLLVEEKEEEDEEYNLDGSCLCGSDPLSPSLSLSASISSLCLSSCIQSAHVGVDVIPDPGKLSFAKLNCCRRLLRPDSRRTLGHLCYGTINSIMILSVPSRRSH
jgi:hypothetical protein